MKVPPGFSLKPSHDKSACLRKSLLAEFLPLDLPPGSRFDLDRLTSECQAQSQILQHQLLRKS